MFEELLEEFKSVTKGQPRNDETLFEICGFPHYENVVSNVLSFFFDDQNQHNLNGLLLKSLLESAKIDRNNIGLQFQAEREVRTQGGGYIDILLHNEVACIVIENKIYSSLNNDLEDYFKYAQSQKKEHVFGILLTLFKTDPENNHFINVTYSDFITKIRKNLGNFIDRNYNKHMFLLIDLINNLETLQSEAISMNSEFVKFIKENHEEVNRLGVELKTYHDNLRKIVKKVNSIVVETINNNDIEQWAWRKLPELHDVAVSDFKLHNGIGIAVDSSISPYKWQFDIFVRSNPGIDFSIQDFCINLGFDGYLKNNRFVLHDTMPVEAKPQDVAKKINNIISTILRFGE